MESKIFAKSFAPVAFLFYTLIMLYSCFFVFIPIVIDMKTKYGEYNPVGMFWIFLTFLAMCSGIYGTVMAVKK